MLFLLSMKDYSQIICCPFCKSTLLVSPQGYECPEHGLFEKDNVGRPLLIKKNFLVKNLNEQISGINWLKSLFKKYPKFYYSIWHIFCPVMMLCNGPRMIFKYLNKKDVLVDIGSGPKKISKEFINVDIFPFPEVDIVSDAANLPFKNNSVDVAISESVFEHVSDANKMAEEIIRIVKPGGLIYVSVPFITPYHASPDDFSRWTISGLKQLFSDVKIIRSGVRSGPWSALLMFLAYWFGVIFSFGYKKASPFLAHFFMLVLGPLKFLDYFFIKIPGSEAVAAQIYFLGRKE